ncbi:type V secretory pathway adhesin [Buttiauxella gaviniae ATCC 51604]|uniref:Type V secretory pathway adhesin n=1 Tax=Buttiauxella gaviniae ATCC 51604 TaxID=1354253 RepID=A0A1B7HIW0_9ENTR|nr:type V secretory pathway adhesin [Buttiauxella gaviniae ATCC 51604]
MTLGGTLNVVTSQGGVFDPGVYRLINYTGTMTNNGLAFGTIPSSDYSLQTSVANQVNLLNSAGLTLNVWDGDAGPKYDSVVNGGNGTWQATQGNENWTDPNGLINAPFTDRAFAIFEATPGTVTVDNSLGDVTVAGMQFASDGYLIQGQPIVLAGSATTPDQSIIRVGDGTASGAAYTATIDSELTGRSRLVKTDLGTLVLSGGNTYTGGTVINGGVVSIADDANLGDIAGGVTLNDGTLRITDNLATTRAITTGDVGGTVDVATDKAVTLLTGVSGTGGLTKQGTGELQLTQASTYAGATHIAQGTLSTLNSGVLNAASPVQIDSNATLNLANNNQQTGSLTNNGTIDFGSIPGTQLVVNGDYQGTGGRLVMNSVLAGDDSLSDRLTISGASSGTTELAVTNRGGLGASTVDGIKVVSVGGASNSNFTLKSDYLFQGKQAIVAGAYSYQLYKNGVTSPRDGSWYLRSQLTTPVSQDDSPPPPPPPPPPLTDGSSTTPPITGGSSSAPQVTQPVWQPGVPLYESYSTVLSKLNTLSTFKQRIGGRSWSDDDSAGNNVQLGSWGRIVGEKAKNTAQSSATDSTLRSDTIMWQLGEDKLLKQNEYGALVGGINARYGKVNADVNSLFGKGSIDTTGYGPGLTLTWYGNNGWYSDNQAQLSWYQSSLNSDTLNKSMTDNNHAHGYALSTEVGKHFALSDNWSLTPQTQLVYSSVKFNDFTDPYGTAVHDNGNGSLVWRVGVAPEYQHNWQDGKGHSGIRVYGIMDIEKTFSSASSVNVSGINVSRQDQAEWGNVGMGGEVQLADGKYRLYGEVSGKTALKGSPENNYAGSATVGFRMNF